MNSGEETFTTREAAAMLGVSLRTVQLWVESGVLKAWKTPGGHRKIYMSSVRELLRARGLEAYDPPPSDDIRRILLVEDDADLRRFYELNMAAWNPPVRVRTAADGFDGLIKLGEEKPDVLISDLMMPGVDGFEMVKALRAVRDYQGMDIIVITGMRADQISARGGLPDGVTVFFKPVDFDKLQRWINRKPIRRMPANDTAAIAEADLDNEIEVRPA